MTEKCGAMGPVADLPCMTDIEPAPPTGERPPRLPGEIWILVVTAFLVAIGYGLVSPALPSFARTFGVGISAASAVVSAFAVFRLGFAPVSGRLVNAFGERRIFIAGLLIVAGSTGVCALAQTYWQLLTFRAVGGIGSTMFTVSALSLLIKLSPAAQRGRASGLWGTGFLLGSITGPLFGGGLVAVSLRAPFVVYAVVLVITAVVGALFLRRSTLAPEIVDDGRPDLTLRAALRVRAYRAALVGNFTNGWLNYGVRVALVPLFVVEVLGQKPSWAGIALTVFAAGNAASMMLAGRWADRRGRRPPILLGLAISAAATGSLGFITSLPVFIMVSLLGGLGGGLINPPLNAVVADVIGNRRRGGPALAGFQMVADLGTIVGPLLAGAIAQGSSYGFAFAVSGMVALFALAAWSRAPETLRAPPAVPPDRAAAMSGDPATREATRAAARPESGSSGP
jgi:MFS family permease